MRAATVQEHLYATYEAKASYCRALSLRVEERSSEPKTEISTLYFLKAFIGIVSRTVRAEDLVTYDSNGRLMVVARADSREAIAIAHRIARAHCLQGYGDPHLEDITTLTL